MAGVALGLGAWGMVTGVAKVKSGMTPWLATLMSVMVFSGTAQLATAPLLATGAPVWVAWATAACLNLRFAIFSTLWRPCLAQLPLKRRAQTACFCAELNFMLSERAAWLPALVGGGAAVAWLFWQRDMLSTIVVGTGAMLSLRLGLGW